MAFQTIDTCFYTREYFDSLRSFQELLLTFKTRSIYNYCTKAKMNGGSIGSDTPKSMCTVIAIFLHLLTLHLDASLMGREMYHHLMKYFTTHLTVVRKVRMSSSRRPKIVDTQGAADHMDESLLKYYTEQWIRYTTASGYINHLFQYLNRHWVKREQEDGKKSVYDVYTVRPCSYLVPAH